MQDVAGALFSSRKGFGNSKKVGGAAFRVGLLGQSTLSVVRSNEQIPDGCIRLTGVWLWWSDRSSHQLETCRSPSARWTRRSAGGGAMRLRPLVRWSAVK